MIMKISKKQLLGLSVLPIAVFLLSGCGQQTAPANPQAPTSTQQGAAQSASQTADISAQPAAAAAAATPAQVEAQLPALPADNKQAIDAQLNNIDKDISATASTNNSTDLSNANLGL